MMNAFAILCAFETEADGIDNLRGIKLPQWEVLKARYKNGKVTDGWLEVAELAYQYGQNDFQAQPKRSVSVGDVIVLADTEKKEIRYYLVEGCGFYLMSGAREATRHCEERVRANHRRQYCF